MDCCNTDKKSEPNTSEKVKGGKSPRMEKRIWLWIVIAVLFIAVLFLAFKAGAVGSSSTAIQSASSASKSAASSYSGMVGGC